MSVEIQLTRGLVAIVDEADAQRVSAFKWYASSHRCTSYAVREVNGTAFYMHRFILGLKRGQRVDVDHINGDGLDNRRCNLRAVSHRSNVRSQIRLRNGKSSRFKGVCRDVARGKWVARVAGRNLGRFASEVEAAKAYDALAVELFGVDARTNAMLGLYDD